MTLMRIGVPRLAKAPRGGSGGNIFPTGSRSSARPGTPPSAPGNPRAARFPRRGDGSFALPSAVAPREDPRGGCPAPSTTPTSSSHPTSYTTRRAVTLAAWFTTTHCSLPAAACRQRDRRGAATPHGNLAKRWPAWWSCGSCCEPRRRGRPEQRFGDVAVRLGVIATGPHQDRKGLRPAGGRTSVPM
jgi:hypothetical protein